MHVLSLSFAVERINFFFCPPRSGDDLALMSWILATILQGKEDQLFFLGERCCIEQFRSSFELDAARLSPGC